MRLSTREVGIIAVLAQQVGSMPDAFLVERAQSVKLSSDALELLKSVIASHSSAGSANLTLANAEEIEGPEKRFSGWVEILRRRESAPAGG